jgi:putative ATP-dependent endonuclease of the OLD family
LNNRLYSEFGIPCYIIFDGDKQNQGKDDEANTISKNHDLIGIFEDIVDFPETEVKKNYLVFETNLKDNLGFAVGHGIKALKLYRKVKKQIVSKEQLPDWVEQIIEIINEEPNTANSILKTEEI